MSTEEIHQPQPSTDGDKASLPTDAAQARNEVPAETDAPSESVYVAPSIAPQNVQADPEREPIIVPAKGDGVLIPMPAALDAVLSAAQKHLPENFTPAPDWGVIAEMAEGSATDGEFESALSDPSRKWVRAVAHNGKRIGAQNLTMPSIQGKEVSGDQALLAYRTHTRSSAGGSICLWSSGISIKFNALTNDQLYDLSREIASSRLTAGRATYGIALSQHMVYTAEALLEAAKAAVFKSSLKQDSDIGDVIRLTDFNTMVWGMAVATFPHGFDISRACTAKPGSCQHVVRERVMVRRMELVDDTALSDEQRKWLADLQDGKHSSEDILPYQDMFAKARSREYTIKSSNGLDALFTLRVPTINEFIAAGKLWVDDVNRSVIRTIGETASFAKRNEAMEERMALANARQYSHWVESIAIDGGKIVDPDAIRRILVDEVSADSKQLQDFIEAVRDFSDRMAVSVVAIPNFKCPSCGKFQMEVAGHEGEEQQPPTYVPVEAVSTFFGLTYQKLAMASR